MRLTEGHIHVAMRAFLRDEGWRLIAGQYPGGSDDEIPALHIVDPVVARDNSPDPRMHSRGKLVPDLVALRSNCLLIVEAKVRYSDEDRQKLRYLLSERQGDLVAALTNLSLQRDVNELHPISGFQPLPALAFASGTQLPFVDPDFAYIIVEDLANVSMRWPSTHGCLDENG